MTLCQHGSQSDAGYECSACVTTPPRDMCAGMPLPVGDTVPRCGYFAAHHPHPIGESLTFRGLHAATDTLGEVLKLIGPPPAWKPADPTAVLEEVEALRLEIPEYVSALHNGELGPTLKSVRARLDRIEQYLRSEKR